MMNTIIRDYTSDDHNFVMASFLNGTYYGNKFYSMVDKDIFMNNYKHIAEALISQNQVKIACPENEPEVIIGYSILSNDFSTIHWVYIKKDWRTKFGIFRMLVPMRPESYSHFTKQGLDVAKKCFPNTTFNPFRLK